MFSFKYVCDWYFWSQISLNTNVLFIGKRLNYFRRHTSSASNKYEKMGLGVLEHIALIKLFKKRYNIHLEFGIRKIISRKIIADYLTFRKSMTMSKRVEVLFKVFFDDPINFLLYPLYWSKYFIANLLETKK
jgi:hypothetical protein